MKIKQVLFFVLLYVNAGVARQNKVDSLVSLIQNEKAACPEPCLADTIRVNHLLALIAEVRDESPDTVILLSYEALRLSEKIKLPSGQSGWQPGIGQSYHQIATYYGMKGDYVQSLNYYSKALEVWDQLQKSTPVEFQKEIKKQQAKSLGNIGMVQWHQGHFVSALDYYFKALTLDAEIGNKNGVARHLGNIGNVYKDQGDFQSALDFELRALKINQELGNKNGIATVLGYIGSLYVTTKKYDEAEKFLLNAVASSDSIGDLYAVMEVNQNLSDLYSKTGRDKKALEYYKKAMATKDSLFNEEKEKEITRKAVSYEFEKREAAVKAEQNKKDALAAAEIQNQKIQKYFIIAGLMMLFALALVLYNRYRLKQKSNLAITKAYEDLKNAQEQLIYHEKMASLGQLTAGIAHEIQNPLNFVINFSELSNELIDEIKSAKDDQTKSEMLHDLHQNLEKIHQHGRRADSIVKNMLTHSRNAEKEAQVTDINDLCSETLDLAFFGMKAKHPGFSCTVEKVLDEHLPPVNIVAQDISRVLLNILNNAFYAVQSKKSDGKVALCTEQKNHSVVISIKDNGGGIPEAIRNKIFQPFFTTKPTHEGTGLGLSISYDIVKAHGGEIKVESNGQTCFQVIIPISAP